MYPLKGQGSECEVKNRMRKMSENFVVVFGQKSEMTVDVASEDNSRMSTNEYSEQHHE